MEINRLKTENLIAGADFKPGKPKPTPAKAKIPVEKDTVYLSSKIKSSKSPAAVKSALLKSKPQKTCSPAVPKFLPLGLDRPENPRPTFTLEQAKQIAQPFKKLEHFTDPENQARMEDFYAEIFGTPELRAGSEKLSLRWVLGEGEENLRTAFANLILKGLPPANPLEKSFFDLLATRRERWERLAEKLGIQAPQSFHLFRGVRGESFVSSVLKAWNDPGNKEMLIPNHELSSWSLDPKVARAFAEGADCQVIYEAEIPFNRTVMDKWADGHSFITLCPEQQEVVVGASKNSLKLPKSRASVVYRNKAYSYENRQELLREWNKGHS